MLKSAGIRRQSEEIVVLLARIDPGDAYLIRRALHEDGAGAYRVRDVAELADLEAKIHQQHADVLVLDVSAEQGDGMAVMKELRAAFPELPIVALTPFGDDAAAAVAMDEGAQDHCIKGRVDPKPILRSIQYAVERKRFDALSRRVHRSDHLASVGQLAAGVAHEINNPISFLLANLNMMKERLGKLDDVFTAINTIASSWFCAEDREVISTLIADHDVPTVIRESRDMLEDNLVGMERIREITRSLQGFSRIDRDTAAWVKFNDIVRSACNMAFTEIRHRAELVKDLGDLPAIVADRDKLSRAVLNVLLNAAHSIDPGAAGSNRITVQTRHVNGRIVLTVEDTGCGIASGDQEHVFEPFFTTKSREIGTGLGLSQCAEAMRAHRGTVRLKSELGKGTSFFLTLPEDTGLHPDPVVQKESAAVASTSRARVLLIDDDEMVRRSYRRVLEKHHEVVEATGGKHALGILVRDREFDILLCDLMMPDCDGTMLYETLGKMAPPLRDRMVFISGGAFTARAKGFVSRTGVSVMQKPIDCQELLRAVEEMTTPQGPDSGIRELADGTASPSAALPAATGG